MYDGMDKSIIMKASVLVKGGFGPSGLDADGWYRILTSRALEPSFLDLFVASRLIPLDKKTWVMTNWCREDTMADSL